MDYANWIKSVRFWRMEVLRRKDCLCLHCDHNLLSFWSPDSSPPTTCPDPVLACSPSPPEETPPGPPEAGSSPGTLLTAAGAIRQCSSRCRFHPLRLGQACLSWVKIFPDYQLHRNGSYGAINSRIINLNTLLTNTFSKHSSPASRREDSP